ncbi:MAG: pseudaminic acid synthase [Gemmatimonadetes bacterium]|nr:pseudaminic acid synthase [Gemmatimonadota bacterium]
MRVRDSIAIGTRRIGNGHPCYLIAEMSGNHNGDLDRALATIRAAAEAGADAVKLQTYTADTMTLDIDQPEFRVPGSGPWGGRLLYDLYEEAHTPWEWHPALFEEGRKAGIQVFSTPFDSTAVDFLEGLDAPAYKIASFELIDDALLARVAATGKPIIMSTGMASKDEVAHAVATLRRGGVNELALLRCTSAYPAPDIEMNLRTMAMLQDAMECPVGLSDHSRGIIAPVVAVSLGACLIEKHFTLSRADGGVDSHFSVEPEEFRSMVASVRRAEAMVGSVIFGPGIEEKETSIFRRSLYVVADLQAGDTLTTDNVRSIRPGFGLAPKYLELVLGRPVRQAVRRGTALTWELLGSSDA